jgi:hypothetical protein
LTILILGILGIYIANILSETKRRPYTIVRKVHRNQDVNHSQESAPTLDFRREARR